MKIRFADKRPEGDYTLVLPVAGKDMKNVGSLGAGKEFAEVALKRQRFDGEAASAAELFTDASGRVLVVGTGEGVKPADAAEKLGGTMVARLLVSGEKHAVIDLSDLGYDADAVDEGLLHAVELEFGRHVACVEGDVGLAVVVEAKVHAGSGRGATDERQQGD